jgi:hypothetical protein
MGLQIYKRSNVIQESAIPNYVCTTLRKQKALVPKNICPTEMSNEKKKPKRLNKKKRNRASLCEDTVVVKMIHFNNYPDEEVYSGDFGIPDSKFQTTIP